MPPAISTPTTSLRQALLDMLRHPFKNIVPPWSWKAAAFSALVRSAAFFGSNLQSGRLQATKAMLVEAVFAVFAGGLIGAISQQLRRAEPLWATAAVVWLGLPTLMVLAQIGVHHLAGTPHQTGGVTVSFCLASIAAAYSWYAMRRGAMLGGVNETTVRHDMKALPGISVDFLLVLPRLLVARLDRRGERN